ncbi:MAG: hypothetical protein IT450_09330 [Phycisphaerales bacterium]|nr:hypothetical protein [Phycisphaerales bacterium]
MSTIGGCLCTRLAAAADRSNRGMLLPLLTVSFLLSALPRESRADQYWVAWEGNDYPENEGWTRRHYGDDGPPAIRSLADGVMTLDGLASIEIIDAYRINRPLDPEPGEVFVAQWGLRVNEVSSIYPYDPGFELTSDDGWLVSLVFGVNEAHSILEQDYFAIEGAGFHAWEFRSADMRSYVLSMDGSVVFTGALIESSAGQPRIIWGDDVAGASSHSDWDYFRFGVVPEPGTCFLWLAPLLCARLFRVSRNPGSRRLRRIGRTSAGVRKRDARAG